tara:strand:- start:296 stop:568 length:273 start_codon:yes stop_codon:yes gene_type:complete
MNKMVNGVVSAMTDAEIAAYNASLPTDAEILASKWASVRAERNGKLAQTDWRAGSDLTLSDDWKTYRQALRDLPSSQSDPDNITFPTEPS